MGTRVDDVKISTPALEVGDVNNGPKAEKTAKKTHVEPKTTRTGNASTIAENGTSPLLESKTLDSTTAVTAGIQAGRWNRDGASIVTATKVEAAFESGDFSGFKYPPPKALVPYLK